MSIRALYSDTRGANAIEYALIGAFLGIGLIAALVTTRGSLNQTFGAAATQMDSAVAAISPAPAKAGPSITDWLAKSIANQTSRYISLQKYTITNMSFTDGSSAIVRTAMNLSAPYTFFTDPANPDVNYNVSGGKTLNGVDKPTTVTTQNYAAGFIQSAETVTFNSDGSATKITNYYDYGPNTVGGLPIFKYSTQESVAQSDYSNIIVISDYLRSLQ